MQKRGFASIVKSEEEQLGVLVEQTKRGEDVVKPVDDPHGGSEAYRLFLSFSLSFFFLAWVAADSSVGRGFGIWLLHQRAAASGRRSGEWLAADKRQVELGWVDRDSEEGKRW